MPEDPFFALFDNDPTVTGDGLFFVFWAALRYTVNSLPAGKETRLTSTGTFRLSSKLPESGVLPSMRFRVA